MRCHAPHRNIRPFIDSSPLPVLNLPVRPDLPNDILPNYDVLDLIGRGGMGVVYKARQVSLDRVVAIKLLPREIIRDDLDFRTRFKQEAQTMARLSHPGIVAVHDFGEVEDGQLFFVMEFIEGTDLAKIIEQRGALPVDEALCIFQRVVETLMYAHEQGIVHRDIKPANVLIRANGEVKVADFGLAKIVAPGTVALTATSTSMGSHDFAAPEVFVHGSDADHRADIYSLGVMLYQMLTGVIPRGMFKLPSERVPGLDTRFDEIICKAMEQDRGDRFQSAREILNAVVFAGRNENVPPALAVPTDRESGSPSRGWAAVAAGVALLGGAAWFVSNRTIEPIPISSEARDAPWTDVLAQIDLTRHRRAGRWQKVNGTLENTDPVAGGVIEFPITAPGASDLRIKLTRLTTSSGKVTVAFSIGARGGQFTISDYSRPGAGLEHIDGKGATENGARVEHIAAYLTIGLPRELLLQLREEGMIAVLDGREIYRWKGDWSRVSQGGTKVPETLTGKNAFALYVGNGRLRVDEIRFREVPGMEGKTLPPEPPADEPRTPPLPEPQIFAGNGHRYQFVPGLFTWTEAYANAKSRGGHLATLTSQEENDWVWRTFSPWVPSQLASAYRARGWWTGGMLDPESKQWKWVTGEPFEFSRLVEDSKDAEARVPRLLQHDNGGNSMLSAWRAMHYSSHMGYVIEWDDAPPSPGSDAEARKFVAWLATLPASTEPNHAEHHVPDFMIEGINRNLRKLSDLPDGPFVLTRVRIGPLRIDDTAREHLDMLSRQTKLYDLRIYGAEGAEVLACMKTLKRLGTLVVVAGKGERTLLPDDELANFAQLTNLNSLRLERWTSLTGRGFAHFHDKRKLSALSLNDCPDLSDEGLKEIVGFKNLETLSLAGAGKITDAGMKTLAELKNLKSLNLSGTSVTDNGVTELRALLPGCVISR